MRQRTLGNRANPTTFEDEAELITDLVTDGTMKTVPFTAVHEVTRQLYVYCTHICALSITVHMYTYKCINERGEETKPGTRDDKPKQTGARGAPSLK